ncbi:MAG: hypothetical protein OES41_07010, partial [Rhodospirillales bacterium]|nr:hypothetical protein [Rhodospirillales bacterium]
MVEHEPEGTAQQVERGLAPGEAPPIASAPPASSSAARATTRRSGPGKAGAGPAAWSDTAVSAVTA